MRRKSAIVTIAAFTLSAVALADTSGTLTLSPLTALDLDSGATSNAGTGDILWSGTTLAAVNPAVTGATYPQTGSANFDAITAAQAAATATTTLGANISSAQLTTGTILIYKTKTGKFSKILITSNSGSLGIKFVTFGGSGGTTGGSGPTISSVMNNYSGIAPGQANYAIAPGSLFFITGTGLATVTTDLQRSDLGSGLQTTLQGVTVSVTVGSTTLNCPLYYLSPTQIDAVLPGNTPAGNGTITVALNGLNSNGFTITVAQSAFGIINYNGTLGATYDANNLLITNFNSANPNQVIVVWGSGIGGDPNNDDRTSQKQNNLTNIPVQVYVGGVSATVLYRGRSQFPGVDQINIIVPANVPTGCYVSLAVVSGSPAVVSNSATIPVAASGKTCSDSNNNLLSPTTLQNLSGKTAVRSGMLSLGQSTQIGGGTPTVTSNVSGFFTSVSNYSSTAGTNLVSIGSCIIQASTTGPSSATTTNLDAGSGIVVSGPQGSVTMTLLNEAGTTLYTAFPIAANFIPASGGPFTFDNGSDGKDVGHFNTSVNFPANFQWTNQATVTTIDRTQGTTVTWSGGAPGVTVSISGSSSSMDAATGRTANGTFTCTAPLSAGSFTVPPPVLLALPAGSGTLSITDNGSFNTFTATGLDIGYSFATVGFNENVRYN
jgi:uncharacterized protein (TIGR03437 family)